MTAFAPSSDGVLQHQLECVAARLLAQVAEQRDVAADDRLQAGPDRPEQRARAHDDAADHAVDFASPGSRAGRMPSSHSHGLPCYSSYAPVDLDHRLVLFLDRSIPNGSGCRIRAARSTARCSRSPCFDTAHSCQRCSSGRCTVASHGSPLAMLKVSRSGIPISR